MLLRLALALGLMLALSGCDPFAQPDTMLDEYVARVGRVLEVEPVLSPVPTVPEFPRMRERVRDIPALNVSMLDFLGLYGCELQHVVGERNSILGRVMHPASRLEYELRFMSAAKACRDEIERDALRLRLDEVMEAKRAVMGDIAWNAVWGSREIEDLFTRSRGPLKVGADRNTMSLVLADLDAMDAAMRRIGAGELDADVKALEPVYQRWLAQPLAGQLFRGASLLSTRLDDATRLIEARLEGAPLCHRQSRNRRADIMYSMFLSVFAGHVQPYLADVQRLRLALLPPLRSLASVGDGYTSQPFMAYADSVLFDQAEAGLWQTFDRSVVRHTRAWQALLEQCGMRPGQS